MDKGQIWVETVIYTLIGLALIAVVLTIITPRINEYKDKAVIEQTISSLNELDSRINEVIDGGVGNARTIQFRMKQGDLYFDKEQDKIYYVLENSRVLYSEPDVETSLGKIKILTEEGVKFNKVILTLDYKFDLDFSYPDNVKKFSGATTPYKFRFENEGFDTNGKQIVSFQETSGA